MNNLSYEIKAKLKEANFPWTGSLDYDFDPSLSELIDALGLKFGSLNRYGDVWDAEPPADDITIGAWSGDTAEEAVASLWLALHNK